MSGSIGACRIKRQDVEDTVKNYENSVLKGFEGYRFYKIVGSYNSNPEKKDFGDIDLCICIDSKGEDLRTVKRNFLKYLSSLPDNTTQPFSKGKHEGEKSQMYGNTVTCQFPITGSSEGVQVDNMISLSSEGTDFLATFLSLDAASQSLLSGLVRVLLLEENSTDVFSRLNISNLPKLNGNQEFEFVLSSSGLSLRKVTLDDSKKEIDREEIWRSVDWSDVQKLLKNFGDDFTFENLLSKIDDRVHDTRARNRIVGIVSSIINISSGEVGTDKGKAKEKAISDTMKTLGEYGENVVGLYGGGFKPPHRGHYEVLKNTLRKVNTVRIFIGSGKRDGILITPEQSKKIWEIYIKKSGWTDRVTVEIVGSPVSKIYEVIQDPSEKDTQFKIVKTAEGESEDKKWSWFLKNRDKFPNVELFTAALDMDDDGEKVSASDVRSSKEEIESADWIPHLSWTPEELSELIGVALQNMNSQEIKNEMINKIMETLENQKKCVEEGASGVSVSPRSVCSSEKRAKLAQLYYALQDQFGDQFNIKFNQSNILILPSYVGELPVEQPTYRTDADIQESKENTKKFDYSKNIASLIDFMESQGVNLHPLPEIIFDKGNYDDNSLLAKTGDYDPQDKVIRIHGTEHRHPVDVLRSTAHELIHHNQNLESRIGEVKSQKTSDDSNLEKLEEEAYEKGNILYRKWLEDLGKYE